MSLDENIHGEISRWMMRYTQAGVPLKQIAWTITAGSTLVTALKAAGFQGDVVLAIGAYLIFQVVFMWAYDRFKILNRQMKLDADRSSNFMPPKWCMDNLVRSKQFSVMTQAINEGWYRDKTDKKMLEETKKLLKKYRKGIDPKTLEPHQDD